MEILKTYIYSLISLSEESVSALLSSAKRTTLEKGDYVLEEGELCTDIFFISSGLCKSCTYQDGREINIAFHFEKDFFTNIKSIIKLTESDYAIKACEKTELVRFNKATLQELYKQYHDIESFGRTVLELMIARHEEHTNSFKLLSPKQRYEELTRKHPEFLQRVSLTQAASYLGISRETLSRIRALK